MTEYDYGVGGRLFMLQCPSKLDYTRCSLDEVVEMTEKKYGVIEHPKFHFPGYSLNEVLEMAELMNSEELDLYNYTGDLAIGPALLIQLVNRVKELESGS